jgi:ubiquinone/menaquinone biosynthesis C-methylase UbiE
MSLAVKLATFAMRWGNQHSYFKGQQCYTEEFVTPVAGEISIATRREFADGSSFFHHFQGLLREEELRDKEVLDLGCGHGGRTAYYLAKGHPRSITGLEISFNRVRVADQSARRICDDQSLNFATGFGETLPFKEASFDTILSYDVFEHVQDLPQVLEECFRVLKPGGTLYALFPPYYGARAHHLDFITTIPFLHHIFAPKTLVQAANQIIEERSMSRDGMLSSPVRAYQGREVLPRLNGTTEREFKKLVAHSPFEVIDITLLPFAWGPGGALKKGVRWFCQIILKWPLPFTRDVFVSTIRCILRKP